MVGHFHGWLYLEEENGDDAELINHARTAAYLASSTVLGCGTVSNVLDDGGCEAYTWVPPGVGGNRLLDEDGIPILDEGGDYILDSSPVNADDWYQETFTTPSADNAPWYNPTYPESAQALGFWITEWTGLDSGHVKRTSTPVGAYRGGSVLGVSSNAGRIMGLEVLLIAESERAMEYLFRWFEATISSVCSTCATDSILIRRYCPDVTDPDDAADGVAEIRGVGLVSGMIYGDDPVEQAGCFLRRVNFTLEATDPCMYSACTGVAVTQAMDWDACFAAANLDVDRTQCRPTCSELTGNCRLSFDYAVDVVAAAAPVIEITAPSAGDSVPMRIRTYMNDFGYGPDELCGSPLLAELYVASLPAYSMLKYDMAGRTVEFRDAASGGYVNGFAFVEANDVGIPRFATLGCGEFTTVVEPADFCLASAPDSDLEFAEVTLSLQERMGCV